MAAGTHQNNAVSIYDEVILQRLVWVSEQAWFQIIFINIQAKAI